MPRGSRKPHVTKGNVLDDLGFEPQVSFELKVKSELHSAILKLIRKRGYTPQATSRYPATPSKRVDEG